MAGVHYKEPARAVNAGVVLPGASLLICATGTLNKVAIYAGRLPDIKLPNPMRADSAGRFRSFWLDPTVSYRAILTFGGATIYDVDPIVDFAGSTNDTPLDDSGRVMPFARRTFWLSRTTELATIYTSGALSTPLTNPQVADANGVFTPAYVDESVVYRTKLEKSDGTLVYDVDFPLLVLPVVPLTPTFIAGRSDLGNSIMTSGDGKTWTQQTTGASMGARGLAYSPSLHLVVAVGGSSVGSSPDGVTWTDRTNPLAATVWNDVTWAPSLNLFVAVGVKPGTVGGAMSSPDGITWTARTVPDRQWQAVRWSPRIGLFAATCITSPDNQAVMTSPDGINWTLRTASSISGAGFGFPGYKMTVDRVTENFLIGTRAEFAVCRSPDGITWTTSSVPIGGSAFTDIAADGAGKIVMTRILNDHSFGYSSNNGSSWGTTVNGDYMEGLGYSPTLNRWAAVGNANAPAGKKAAWSDDGTNWTDGTTPTSANTNPSWMRVIYCEM